MRQKRKNISAKFKAEVAIEAIREGKTVSQLAIIYDVHPNLITRWKKEALEKLPQIFEKTRGKRSQSEKRLAESLQKQVQKIKSSIDKLKNSITQ